MKQDVILVLDCGATNVRAMAVDRQGNIIARAATANASDIAAEKSDWHQWSLEAIMQRFADCCRQIHDQLASCTVRGITVTTFGVDGALVDEKGALLYPIISWKCPRTAAVMEKISQYMPARQLQQIAGVGAFAFNTLYKLVWLKENHPQLLAQAHAWLFISSLINHRLTGSSPPTSPWRAPARCSISGSAISARRSCRRPACRAACSRGWLKQASRSAPCCRRPLRCWAFPSGSRLSRPGMTPSSLCLAPAPGRMSRCSPPGPGRS